MGVVPPADGFLPALRDVHQRTALCSSSTRSSRASEPRPRRSSGRVTGRPDLHLPRQDHRGGLPVGAYGGRADLMELVAPAGPVYQAGTLSGNPLAMTAGIWSLERLTPAILSHLRKLGARLAEGIAKAGRGSPRGGSGECLRLSFDSVFHRTQPVRDLRIGSPLEHGRYAAFFRGCSCAEHIHRPHSSKRGSFPPPHSRETSKRRSRLRGKR